MLLWSYTADYKKVDQIKQLLFDHIKPNVIWSRKRATSFILMCQIINKMSILLSAIDQ